MRHLYPSLKQRIVSPRWLMCLLVIMVASAMPSAATSDSAAADILPFPYSADEIRHAWQQGLVLTVETVSPQGTQRQRWTVRSADAEGADIEYANLTADGSVAGEPAVQRATWTELRDHATFAAATASRQKVQRKTALGKLNGWLYTVVDEAAGTTTELFFADGMAGAPTTMVMHKDGVEMMSMRQVERLVP